MRTLERLWTVIKANLNALIGRAEDPAKVIEQALADMQDQLAKAQQRTAAAIGDEKKLKEELDRERKLSEEWEGRAVLALKEGREDLAKQGLLRQAEHAQNARQLQSAWQQHQRETVALRESLRGLHGQVEELKRKKNVLLARQTSVEAQQQIQSTLSSLNDQSAIATFKRMEEKIADMERQTSAAAELAAELTGDALEKEFQQLEQRGAADQQLLDLKRKLGLDAGPAKRLGSGREAEADDAVVVEERKRG